jgi:O-antigen/teichoic acid export membrane protein
VVIAVTKILKALASNSKPLSLRRNFSWTFLSNAIYGICQWGILVVIAKLGSPEMVGRFTLGIAVITPIILFVNLQLRTVQVTDVKQQYNFSDYLVLRLISSVLGMLAIIGVIFVGGYKRETSTVILFMGIAKTIESISDVFYGLQQQCERMDKIAQSTIIRNLLSLIIFFFSLYFSQNLIYSTACLIFTSAFTLLFCDIPNTIYLLKYSSNHLVDIHRNLFSNQYLSRKCKVLINLIWVALPAGLAMVAINLIQNIPRYFIEYYLGERELGIFSGIAYLPLTGYMFIVALGQSALSPLSKYYNSGNIIAFKKLIAKLVLLAFLLGLTGIVISTNFGKLILTIMYKPEYAQQTSIFNCLMIWGGISYISSFLGYAAGAARYFKARFISSTIMLFFTMIGSLLLIPSYGLQGAAFVLIFNVIIELIIAYFIILHAISKFEYGP